MIGQGKACVPSMRTRSRSSGITAWKITFRRLHHKFHAIQ
jgi:hypothetical protein